MRILGVLGVLMLMGLASACAQGKAGVGGHGGDAWPADRSFWSTSVIKGDTGRPLVAGTRIQLQFFADGRLSANAGCNMLGGVGRIDGGRLIVTDLSSTDMGCAPDMMAQDTWLGEFLGAEPSWQLADTELILRGGDTTIRLMDRRVLDPDRLLVGSRWVVDTVINGTAASSVPAGVEANLQFREDGAFEGSTGCAPISGATQIGADVIAFGAVERQPRTCPADAAALDAAVMATLRGDVGYAIHGRYLTLTGADGAGLRLRAD